jgi:transposase
MDDSVGTSIMASKPKKCYRSVAERRQIVEEALVPGVSVSAVARAHGVNTNLVFHWRKLYHAGLLSSPEPCGVRLLPVRVEGKGKKKKCGAAAAPAAAEHGTLEVKLANAQVRMVGNVNGEVLRAVMECLLG